MLALTRSNLMMMARNRQGLFWALFFPLLLVVVFGLIDFNGVVPAPVAVVDLSDGSRAQVFRERLADVEFLDVEEFVRTDMAEALRGGDLGYLIVIPPGFDETAAAVGEPGHVTRWGWSTLPATPTATSWSRQRCAVWWPRCGPTANRSRPPG